MADAQKLRDSAERCARLADAMPDGPIPVGIARHSGREFGNGQIGGPSEMDTVTTDRIF
jgi:hypothetical protein